MLRGARNDVLKALDLLGLTFSSYLLSTRYRTSAAFERPVHFTVVILFLTGLLLTTLTWWKRPSHGQALTVFASPGKVSTHILAGRPIVIRCLSAILKHTRRLHLSFIFLLSCIALRTWLHWVVIRTSQCSRGGIEAFLPFFTILFEVVGSWIIPLRGSQLNEPGKRPIRHSLPSKSLLIFTLLTMAWPLFVISATESSQIVTGTACPIGWRWEPFTPFLQLIKCVLDAVAITHCANLIRSSFEDDIDAFPFIGKLSLTTACTIFLLSFPAWLTDSEFMLTFRFHFVDIRDLVVDGLFSLTAVVCSLSLLTVLHPAVFALLITSASFVGFQVSRLGSVSYLSPTSFNELAKHTCLVVALAVPLWVLAVHLPITGKSAASPTLYRWLPITNLGLVALGWVCWLIISDPPTELPLERAVMKLMLDADTGVTQWKSQAAKSGTLAAAVTEYERRYGIPPPPHFDKWYEFAVKRNSAIIDDFGQIYHDLLPFWAEDPATLRAKTAQVLSYATTGVSNLRIRDGTVQQSPHIPGSHRWMTDTLEKMIQPFAKWLPDMDLAINLGDECSMAIPYEEMELLKHRARENRDRVRSSKKADWTKSDSPHSSWPEDFAEPISPHDDSGRVVMDPLFRDNIRTQIFYDWVAASCPPSSKARNSRWWDWSTTCVECMRPHSLATSRGALMTDVSLAHDLCHQPDIAYLDGFIMSPAGLVSTQSLLPIFSQSRAGGFSDILFPSPWNFNDNSVYDENAGTTWENKTNALFWRGSASDGFASHGRWPGFLRARFVHEAYKKDISSRSIDVETPLGINVSFTGGISKCDGRECAMELDSFELWGKTAMNTDASHQDDKGQEDQESHLPPKVPFEEHWHYRHLMDMDGAGFSGRFLSFLESHSLPYRAALFRTWYDERLRAWHHYVPVDIRLGSGFWALLDFFSGGVDGSNGDKGGDRAKRMAEQGREWAQKALRREDMQIYMFRLLLEWGRIVDDNRENLGFVMEE